MRPQRLELKGFSAFREHTEVSFEDCDLVALVGPTGSGKSSLIDALTFALYGTVSRYDDARAVEPVIHQLETEARVRLDFELGGERYTAVRVVRRLPKGGASTKEARLVHQDGSDGGTVLAGSAREMAGAVDRLLHLSFEQFTKTVVLPQGDFAAFLREGPKERQELLRRLLDVEVYAQMGERARVRARTADDEHRLRLEERQKLATLDDDARAQLETRASALAGLGPEVDQHLADVARLRSEREVARQALETAAQDHAALTGLAVPEDVAGLAAALAEAADDVARRDGELADARARRDEAEAALATVDAAAVEVALERLDRRDRLRTDLADDLAALTALAAELTPADEALANAEVALATATTAADHAAAADQAGSLVAALAVGDPCPVCRQEVHVIPDHDVAAELAAARATLAEARRDHRARAATAAEVRRRHDTVVDRHARRTEEAAALDIQIGTSDDRAALESDRARSRELGAAVAAARTVLAEVEAKAAAAQRALRDAQARETAERRHLTEARDAVASRRPPPPEGASLQADWEALVTWATTTAGAVADEVAGAEAKVATIKRESLALHSAIDEACRPVAIDVDPIDGLVRRVAEAQADARGQLAQDDRDRARATELDETLAGLVTTRDVAAEMGHLLSVKGFERWLLQAALDDLVVRATERLLELSGGQYSLLCDDGDFFVRDHRNADERRGVRTLSGGETFLASLSLALALAENVAELAAEGGPKLESMFLDEGFGTLDPDTLDLVASSVEELSASGRFVGIVTHIRELADRVPTRFEVSRDAVTARVARVEA